MAQIRFIRGYSSYGCDWLDIIYQSGRVYTLEAVNAPATAKRFMDSANQKKQYDSLFKRDEIIYEK
jgi:hypothetical protein